MFCSRCGARQPDNASFCIHCGTGLGGRAPTYCSECGTQMPDDSAFCHRCGARIAVEQSRGDERSAGENTGRLPPPAGPRTGALAVPGWVSAQLLPGEAVLARTSGGHADYFATDRRLLRFRRKSNCEAVPYSHLSVSLQMYGWGWQIFKLFAVVFSFAVVALGILALWGPTVGDTDYGGPTPIAIAFFVAGGLTLLAVLVYRYRYYQISVWRADRGSSERWCIERPRVAIGNAALDRFAAVLEKRSRASGSPQAETPPRPRPRLWMARTGLKWLPMLGGAVVGGALLVLYVLAADPDFHVTPEPGFVVTSERIEVTFEYALVVMTLACAFVGGVTAGLWANWRGGTNGLFSGMIVGGGGYFYIMVQIGDALLDYSRSHLVGIVELSPSSVLYVFFIDVVLAAVAGALGGLLGERMRR